MTQMANDRIARLEKLLLKGWRITDLSEDDGLFQLAVEKFERGSLYGKESTIHRPTLAAAIDALLESEEYVFKEPPP